MFYLKWFSLIIIIFSIIIILIEKSTIINPDFSLTNEEFVSKYGYKLTKHEVTTEDGYILTLMRISKNDKEIINKEAILIMHGLFCNGDSFIFGKNSSLAFNAVDHGYDVWIGNNRGHTYSKKHIEMSAKDTKFWEFSWHEIGYYDLPAMIDYILENTKRKNLFYVGYSQGGTIFYVLTSLKPEYQKKIKQATLLAPSGFLRHCSKGYHCVYKKRHLTFFKILAAMNIVEIPPLFFHENLLYWCSFYFISLPCRYILRSVADAPHEVTEENKIFIRGISGSSIYQIIHYIQNAQKGYFRQYDFGDKKNFEIYSNITPPDYPLDKIKTPITIFYSKSDLISPWEDVLYTCDQISSCKHKFEMKNEKFTHFSFIVPPYVYEEVNIPLISNLNNYKDD